MKTDFPTWIWRKLGINHSNNVSPFKVFTLHLLKNTFSKLERMVSAFQAYIFSLITVTTFRWKFELLSRPSLISFTKLSFKLLLNSVINKAISQLKCFNRLWKLRRSVDEEMWCILWKYIYIAFTTYFVWKELQQSPAILNLLTYLLKNAYKLVPTI